MPRRIPGRGEGGAREDGSGVALPWCVFLMKRHLELSLMVP